jgi:hypothetical protein
MSEAQERIIDQIPKAKIAAAAALVYAAKKYNDARKNDPNAKEDRIEDMNNNSEMLAHYYFKK